MGCNKTNDTNWSSRRSKVDLLSFNVRRNEFNRYSYKRKKHFYPKEEESKEIKKYKKTGTTDKIFIV